MSLFCFLRRPNPLLQRFTLLGLGLFLILSPIRTGFCQDDGEENQATENQPAEAATTKPEISETPLVIPPEQVVPEVLRTPITVDLPNTTIRDLGTRFQELLGITVLLDETALKQINILPADTISYSCQDQSAYLALQRLSEFRIGWILDGDILLLTSLSQADLFRFTVAIPVGDLRDADYDPDQLVKLVLTTLGAEWEEQASVLFLGDVLFVRHNFEIQLRARALMEALRQPARRTLVLVPEMHVTVNEALKQPVDVDFAETPLQVALENIGQQIESPIMIDSATLEAEQIRLRQPVSLSLQQRPAATTLRFLLSPLKLDYIVRNGQILITTQSAAERHQLTAVFDVRDLCPTQFETLGLIDAVGRQTNVQRIYMGRSGVVVVRETEPVINTMLELLENYRLAMRSSKPRDDESPDPAEILTIYYQMPQVMAESVKDLLPELVGNQKWNLPGLASEKAEDSDHPDIGTVRMVASRPQSNESMNSSLIPQSVLIVTHRRDVQYEISVCLRKVAGIESVDWEQKGGGPGNGGLGGGLGGGGGGLFNLGPRSLTPASDR